MYVIQIERHAIFNAISETAGWFKQQCYNQSLLYSDKKKIHVNITYTGGLKHSNHKKINKKIIYHKLLNNYSLLKEMLQ